MVNKKRSKKELFKKIFQYSLMGTLSLIIVAILFGSLYSTYILRNVPTIDEQQIKTATAGTTNIYDKDNNIIYSDTNMRRDYIEIENVPKLYKDILISVEDKDYYTSSGVSLSGNINAGLSLVKEKLGYGHSRGGSTIEQQLIKNLVFSTSKKDRTIDRKIKEIWLSTQINKNYSKDEILEWYINMINMGENSYGANTIAITYYGDSIQDMTNTDAKTIAKLATIAGLGQAPSSYNLYDNPELTKDRRDTVLYAALNNNVITEEQYNEAIKVDITTDLKPRYWRNTETLNLTKEHNAYIMSTLKQVKDMGYNISETPMQIYTALDQEKNKAVKDIFDNYKGYQSDEQQIASTIIDPKTGYVVAQYGGRNTEALGLNRATQTTRSSGSAIKPFIAYGPAIEYFGMGTNTKLDSSPYVYPGTNITAYNYGLRNYGIVDMAFALKMSLNTPANRLLDNTVGSNYAKMFLSDVGLDVKDYYGGSDALGINISTEKLANAFATLSNLGEHQEPQYVTKIVFNDKSKKTIIYNKHQTIKQSTAYILLKMLEQVPTVSGTALNAVIPQYAGYAAKTGTVGYDNRDGINRPPLVASDSWIAGTTKNISVAIWTGYDSPNEVNHWLNENNHSQQYLFKQIMLLFNNGKDTSDWATPNGVKYLGNNHYEPVEKGSKRYVFPDLKTSNKLTLFGNLNSNEIDINNIKDDGIEKFKTSEKDIEKAEEWKEDVKEENKEQLEMWEKYPSPLEALSKSYKIYLPSKTPEYNGLNIEDVIGEQENNN